MKQSYQPLELFFQKRISKIQQEQQLQLHELTQLYIVSLCLKAIRSENIFHFNANNGEEIPLAFAWGDAVKQASEFKRYRDLIAVGDRSLYVAGFFSDYFNNKIFGINYYIEMGALAYSQASDLQSKFFDTQDFSIFKELAEQFNTLVDVMSELSEDMNMTSGKNLMVIYEKWLATKSQRLLKKLEKKGLMVNVDKKIIH